METSPRFSVLNVQKIHLVFVQSLCFLWVVQLDPADFGSHPSPDVMMKVC